MRYLGGKARIAAWVESVIMGVAVADGQRDHYVELMVGAGHVFARVAPQFAASTACDIHPDLMAMWRALAKGWVPPTHVSREEYEQLRHAPPSALRGLVGFGASWGGKWFGGYVDQAWDAHHGRLTKSYLDAAVRSLPPVVAALRASAMECASYKAWEPEPGQLIYCDPPYAGGTGYGGAGAFDHEDFWATARGWSQAGAIVLVSESSAPPWVELVAERQRRAMLKAVAGVEQEARRECIWRVP